MSDLPKSTTRAPMTASPGGWSTEDWKRFGVLAYRAARGVLDAYEDLEDVVQKTMSALWVLRHAPPDDVEAWIATVATRRAIDVVRNKVKHRSGRQRLRSLVCPGDEAHEGEDDQVIAKMLIETLLTALPARERQAVELRYLEDLDREAIAQRMHITLNTVKTLLRRGTAHLHDAFVASLGEEGHRE